MCIIIPMRILFYRYNSICEPDVLEAFRYYGLSVIEETTEMTRKSLSDADRISLIQNHLDDTSSDDPYLFVFSINFYPAISEICQIYSVPYVCWTVDSPLAEIYSKSVTNSCNRLFLFDRQQYEDLHALNPECIFHLPLCTNPSRWDRVLTGSGKNDRQRFTSDISFVGSLYTEKDPWLSMPAVPDYIRGFADGLTEAQLQLVGCSILSDSLTDEAAQTIAAAHPTQFAVSEDSVMNMDRYVAGEHILGMHASSLFRIRALQTLSQKFAVDLYTNSPAPEAFDGPHIHGPVGTLTEMPLIFAQSRINLNMTVYPIRSGLSLRIWDVLGCGGFLLTGQQPELNDYFIPGRDLETFSSIEEMLDKCAFYLAHEDIRMRIAASGRQKVLKEHTYLHRIGRMLRIVAEHQIT